jgi:hypothetical protein
MKTAGKHKKNMGKLLRNFAGKKFFFVSLGTAGYFCFLLLNAYVIKSNFVLIGVIQEMATLPLMFFVQPALLVLSIILCINEKFQIKSYSFGAFFILLASNSFCLGNFFYSIVK